MVPIKLKDETEIGAGFFGEGEGISGDGVPAQAHHHARQKGRKLLCSGPFLSGLRTNRNPSEANPYSFADSSANTLDDVVAADRERRVRRLRVLRINGLVGSWGEHKHRVIA